MSQQGFGPRPANHTGWRIRWWMPLAAIGGIVALAAVIVTVLVQVIYPAAPPPRDHDVLSEDNTPYAVVDELCDAMNWTPFEEQVDTRIEHLGTANEDRWEWLDERSCHVRTTDRTRSISVDMYITSSVEESREWYLEPVTLAPVEVLGWRDASFIEDKGDKFSAHELRLRSGTLVVEVRVNFDDPPISAEDAQELNLTIGNDVKELSAQAGR